MSCSKPSIKIASPAEYSDLVQSQPRNMPSLRNSLHYVQKKELSLLFMNDKGRGLDLKEVSRDAHAVSFLFLTATINLSKFCIRA
jgi:hypothetical protein